MASRRRLWRKTLKRAEKNGPAAQQAPCHSTDPSPHHRPLATPQDPASGLQQDATPHRSAYESTPPPGDQDQLRHGCSACWGCSFTPRPSREVCRVRVFWGLRVCWGWGCVPAPPAQLRSIPYPPRLSSLDLRRERSASQTAKTSLWIEFAFFCVNYIACY